MNEALQNEIFTDLSIEIGITDNAEVSVLKVKIKNAIREIINARNYPKHYTEKMIEDDLQRFYSNVKELALYDFNQIGVEGQASHSENGISRTWKDRKECFNGIYPFVKSV